MGLGGSFRGLFFCGGCTLNPPRQSYLVRSCLEGDGNSLVLALNRFLRFSPISSSLPADGLTRTSRSPIEVGAGFPRKFSKKSLSKCGADWAPALCRRELQGPVIPPLFIRCPVPHLCAMSDRFFSLRFFDPSFASQKNNHQVSLPNLKFWGV